MPYSMPYDEQDNKWFSAFIFVVLPFIIFYKVIKKDLPALGKISPKK